MNFAVLDVGIELGEQRWCSRVCDTAVDVHVGSDNLELSHAFCQGMNFVWNSGPLVCFVQSMALMWFECLLIPGS